MAVTRKAIVSYFTKTGCSTKYLSGYFNVTEPYAIDCIRQGLTGQKPNRHSLYGSRTYRKRIDVPQMEITERYGSILIQ